MLNPQCLLCLVMKDSHVEQFSDQLRMVIQPKLGKLNVKNKSTYYEVKKENDTYYKTSDPHISIS